MSVTPTPSLVDTPLDQHLINDQINSLAIHESHVSQSVDSTNSFLMSRPAVDEGLSYCLAEAQQAGRGRHGNNWLSAPNKNIMLSVMWGYQQWPTDVGAMSLAVGVVLIHTLLEETGVSAKLKWPNDILVDDQKLGGILIELKSGASEVNGLVVGVGLNCHQPDWPDRFDYPWVDLHKLGVDLDRNRLAARIILDLAWLFKNYHSTGFKPFRVQFNEYFAYRDRPVVVTQEGGTIRGLARGVDEQGALVIEGAEGIQLISDSRASLRLESAE